MVIKNGIGVTGSFLLIILQVSIAQGQPIKKNLSDSDVPIKNLKLWLRADKGVVRDSNNRVSIWKDQSGNDNDAKQTIIKEQPLYIFREGKANNKPVLRFKRHSLNGTLGSIIKSPISMFAVTYFHLRNQGKKHASYVIMIGNGCQGGNNASIARQQFKRKLYVENKYYSIYTCKAEDDLYGPKLKGRVFQVLSVIHGTNEPRHHLYVNGVKKNVLDDKSSLTIKGNYWLGRLKPYKVRGKEYTHFLDGDIAELLVYNTQLSDSERSIIERYLMKKYLDIDTAINSQQIKSSTAK